MGNGEREREGTIVYEYASHPSKVMTPCMFVVKLSINDVEYIDSGSVNLISVSNQTKKITSGLHAISWFLSWMNERYGHA